MDNASDASFAQRVERCARRMADGCTEGLEELFDLTAPRLVRYAQTLTRSREDAEDAVQQAMLRLARRPVAFASAEWPWSYCMRVVRNEALRVLSRRPHIDPVQVEPTTVSNTLHEMQRQESNLHVQAAISGLPREQAEVVVLKLWEELTLAEIAEITGESSNTIASRYRYALAKLARRLEPLHQDHPARACPESAQLSSGKGKP